MRTERCACRSDLIRAFWRVAAFCGALASAGAPAWAGACADIALVGNKGWWTIPVAKAGCSGDWYVENHEKWLGTGGAGAFATAAATARFVVSGDFDGDGYSDVAALGTGL